MSLENLVKTGKLKVETFNKCEFDGLVFSGKTRLTDALSVKLSKESKFDLIYNASHSLALAALRRLGYRSTNRYLVFQVIPYTTGLGSDVWRVLAKCHDCRNLAEYEGYIEIEDQLLADLVIATQKLLSFIHPFSLQHQDKELS